MLTAAADERGHVVDLLLFPGQCAEATATKRLLPFLANTMVCVGEKSFDSDKFLHLIEDDGGLACFPPRSQRTRYRWYDPEFYRKQDLVETLYQSLKS